MLYMICLTIYLSYFSSALTVSAKSLKISKDIGRLLKQPMRFVTTRQVFLNSFVLKPESGNCILIADFFFPASTHSFS